MTAVHDHVDLLIVGAGPAGLATAISAARNGVRPLLVERRDSTSSFPRATHVSTRTMEVLRSWGIDEQVRAGGMNLLPAMSVSATLIDPRRTVVPMGVPTADDLRSISPTTPCLCPQDHLEPVLVDHLRHLGGDLRFGTEVIAFDQDTDGVNVTLRDRHTHAVRAIRASYVVAADGARSSLRAGLGIPMQGPDNLGAFLSTLFRADLWDAVGDNRYGLYRVEAPPAAGVLVPTSTNDRWVYGREWHPERGEKLADYTPERRTELIRAATGISDLAPEILAVQSFEFAAQVADRYREGRVLLVGDAAHRMTPRGGMGMNTAFLDGHNLGWKLAWILRGWAGAALLDSYEAERRPIGVHNTLGSMGDSEKSIADGLTNDLGITYTSGVIQETVASVPNGDGFHQSASPGARAPHLWIEHDSRRQSTLDLAGAQLTLLIGAAGQAWSTAAATIATSTPYPLVALRAGTDFHDPTGCFHEAHALPRTGALLVRPDGHVAWRSTPSSTPSVPALRSAVAGSLGLGQ